MKTPLIPRKSYANWMLAILVVNILLCFGLIGLFLLIPIGAWQVIDAVVYVSWGDRRRVKYLATVGGYFAIMFLVPKIFDIDELTGIFYMIVIPYIIAFWYWSIVNRHADERILETDDSAAEIEDHLIV